MNRTIIAALVAAVLAPSAMALQVKTGSNYGIYQTGQGGEFTLIAVDLDVSSYSSRASGTSAAGPTFQTFCLESSQPPEYILTGMTYDVVVNEKAVWGGTGVNGPGDPVSQGAGWLYSQFARGTLAGYNFDGTELQREASANLLQRAIWWLEDEGTVSFDQNNTFMAAVESKFGSQAAAKAGSASDYGVYALNLTYVSGGTTVYAQDQIYYVPDGGTTLLLLGLGVIGLAAVSRRSLS